MAGYGYKRQLDVPQTLSASPPASDLRPLTFVVETDRTPVLGL